MFIKKFKTGILSLFLSLLIIFPASSIIFTQNTTVFALDSHSQQTDIHGFSLKKTLYFEGHPVFEYQHEKSGAWVVVEKNNNIDKKFEIIVRTPPENNKGTNHVIEHCVLNGSREYPCKNMIWELSKAAHATYINAITAPTYTAYPVSSTDEDELESLAKIYTSGVFHPSFLEDEKIFKKEGIRYEPDENGKLKPNGTVFNEIQQSTAMYEGFIKRNFPDTQGKNFSGGLPTDIMDLSYGELCDTYKKYYHPSNMLMHLTGDINYEKFFKWLNEDYLNNYEKQSTNSVRYLHQNHENLKKYETVYYYKENTDKNIITASVSYIIKPELYKKVSGKLDIISSVINNPNSPRSKFLKEKGYLDISMSALNTFYDPVAVIYLSADNPELTSQNSVESILDELFSKYPISQSEIDKVLDKESFYDELDQNTQIYEDQIASRTLIMSFIRFGDPCSPKYFYIDEKENITNESKNGENVSVTNEKTVQNTFNNFLSKDRRIITVFLPTDDLRFNTANKIEEKIKSMESQKESLTQNYQEQKQWAESPNDPESVNLIKSMFKKLSDITTPNFTCPLNVNTAEGKKYYQSVQEIGDFISYKFIFKINHLSDEDKKYLEILQHAFSSNDTKNYSREEFEKQKSGKLRDRLNFKIYENSSNEKNAFLILNIISKKDDIEEAMRLLQEQINNINFKDKQTLKEFLRTKNSFYESTSKVLLKFQDLVIGKNLYEDNYLNGNQTEEDKKEFYKEIFSGIDSDEFLSAFSQKSEEIKNKIFNQNSLEGVGICASKDNQDLSKLNAQDFVRSLNNQEIICDAKLTFSTPKKENIAFIEPSMSNNEIICLIDSKELSHDVNFNSTCQLLNNLFLLPLIREKNGAYGASIASDLNNDKIIMSSNKDPNISSTVNIFKSIPEFIKNREFKAEEIESISKNFLGLFFQKNKLNLSDDQIEKAICQKINYCDLLNKKIEKIKNMSRGKIKNHGEILEKLINNMRIYVISGKFTESDEKLFDIIIK